MTEKYRNPLLYNEVIDVSSMREVCHEPIDPISFLYQPERGPKREYLNIATL